MGARTNYYVDPAIAANSGTGTIGDPFGDLQYALNTVTRDSTNGDQFNIKAGTAELLSSALSLATYGNPHSGSFGAPLVFRGYTSAANDGGQGEISCQGNNISVLDAFSSVHWLDMKLGNCGTTWVLGASQSCLIFNCEFHSSRYGVMSATSGLLGSGVFGCYFHDCTLNSLDLAGNFTAIGNYISQSAGTSAINLAGGSSIRSIEHNIISVSGSVHGILAAGYYWRIRHNSILSAGGTGTGIRATGDFAGYGAFAFSNLIEGFSGVGGVGILANSTAQLDAVLAANAVYNCTTTYSVADQQLPNDGSNETLSATPFAKSGSNTFANRFTYFAPQSVGSVLTGAFPTGSNLAKGAVGKFGSLLPLRRGVAT